MGYSRYDEEYYRPTEKVYPHSRNDYPRHRNPLTAVVIVLVLIIVVLGGLIAFFVFRQGSQLSPVVSTPGTTSTSSGEIVNCPPNGDSLFNVPAQKLVGEYCAFVLAGGQAIIPAGWVIQWTPSPADGYQHLEFVMSSSLNISISGATVRKIDVYSRFGGDPFREPNQPCGAAEKIVDASGGSNVVLQTNVVNSCSGRPDEDQKITVTSS